jgi:hypothetical protein
MGFARRGLAAAVLVTAAAYAGVLGVTTSANAAACAGADGVTVVVDFHDLGGGLQQTCDTDGGGRDAASLFVRAGYELTPVQRQPAFVCRINGVPADDPCVNTPPADAYWTLWWSNGTDGRWSYSTLAASSLKIPEGGFVAFSWNRGSGQDKPGVAPGAHAEASPTPKPTPKPTPTSSPKATPTPQPTQAPPAPTSAAPSPSPTTPADSPASPTATKKASDSPSDTPKATDPASESSATTESPSAVAATESDATATNGSSQQVEPVPTWLVVAVIAGLLAGAVAIAVVRRRRHGTEAGP